MNPSGRKGTAGENGVVDYLKVAGFPNAERRAKNGAKDRGDITGLGIPVVIEVKNESNYAGKLSGWLAEAETEARNDAALFGAVWHKRRGKGSAGKWYVTMDGQTFAMMLTMVRTYFRRAK